VHDYRIPNQTGVIQLRYNTIDQEGSHQKQEAQGAYSRSPV